MNFKMTFQSFLSGIPARDYAFQQTAYAEQIRNAVKMIEEADYILIGAGAGLSTAAGLTMGGKRFQDNFQEFIEKYNSPYMTDNCADNIIHSKAGIQLRLKCNCLMEKQGHEEPTGQAKITPAYNLPSKYIIHTVGPIVQGQLTEEHCRLLASCYRSCLEIARDNHITSIAFCCISTGVFMFPNQKAAEIAVSTVRQFLDETGSKMKVVFNVFKDADLNIYKSLLNP